MSADAGAPANVPGEAPPAPVVPAVQQPQLTLLDAPYGQRYKDARLEVPAFVAKPDYTSQQFMLKIHIAIGSYGIHEDDHVRFALSRLEGEASKFQLELSAEGAAATPTLGQFETRLLASFPMPTLERAQYQLLHKVCLKGNNMAKYIQEFNTQVGRAGSGEAGLNALLQELFLFYLGPDLRRAVELSRPIDGWADLAALQATTVSAHSTLGITTSKQTGSSDNSSGTKRQGQQASGHNKRSRMGPSNDSQQTAEGLWCTVCNRAGHDVDSCRVVKRAARHSENRGGSRSGGPRGRGRGPTPDQSKN